MDRAASKRIWRNLPILTWILLTFLVGMLVIRDYGESWDESGIYAYANQSEVAYADVLKSGTLPQYVDVPPHAENYGPAYAMATTFLARRLHAILPAWSHIEGWHLGEFLAFELSILSLYFLARKWMGGWAAMGTTLIYSTQPLLWGHAFINPKDVPFLAFFLASVTAGIYAVDALPDPRSPEALRRADRAMRRWARLPLPLRRIGVAYVLLYLDSLLFIASGNLSRIVADGVWILHWGVQKRLLGLWFAERTRYSSSLRLADYIQQAQAMVPRLEVAYVLVGFLLGLGLFAWFGLRYSKGEAPAAAPLTRNGPWLLLPDPWVLAAGGLLGFTTSIRVAGPYAAVIVLIYAIYKSWRKAALLVIPYGLSALVVCYLTWPYLWADPVHHFLTSVLLMSRYPWNGWILFQGANLPAPDLPAYFLPYLMTVQFTEVVPALFLLGLALSAWAFVRGRQREPFALALLWLVLPVVGIVVSRSTLYNNFRQELFLIPPVFITGGIALEALFSRMRRDVWKALLLAAAVLPGLYADVTLHPYEYIYYNSFVGGVAGVFRVDELDYWATSYREAAQYINQVAPRGATVAVLDPVLVFKDYARRDLKVFSLTDLGPDARYDFVVLLSHHGADETVCPSIPPVKTIAREGAVLAAIKVPPASVGRCPVSLPRPALAAK